MVKAKKKIPFIDKKNSVTFRLVRRSQKDPLVTDSKAPQHVLLETAASRKSIIKNTSSKPEDVETRKVEQRKFGVYFDDDYDYLQHLKAVGQFCLEPTEGFRMNRNMVVPGKKKFGLNLPSSLFQSEIEDKVGVLSRAAPIRGPRPELDPDIVLTLDSDAESETSFLDDDFVVKANECLSDDESDAEGSFSFEAESETDTEVDSCKSRFTNYSLSSSVISRNSGLTLIDDQFEQMFASYDDDKIGALDGEDVDGSLSVKDNRMKQIVTKFMQDKADDKDVVFFEPKKGHGKSKKKIESLLAIEEEEELIDMVIEEPTEKWDCESILSTYSSLYNHPKLIKEPVKLKPIKISSKTGIPVNVMNSGELTAANLKSFDASMGTPTKASPSERSSVSTIRLRGETPEDRRSRKTVVKEQRKDRRLEKKANKNAFRDEKKRQEQVMLNLRQNMNGIKLR